jgi:hypothetical protein
MTATTMSSVLQPIEPVGLAQLETNAALMTRRDRKYLVPWHVAGEFVELLAPTSRVLEIDGRRSFHYQSVYFDTPVLDSYLDAAHKRPHRYKVRTRSYLDSGLCLLEVKTRDARGRTVKERVTHPIDRRSRLDDDGRAFVASYPLIGESADDLRPVLTTRYTRATLLLTEGVRVTIDTDLRSEGPDGRSVQLDEMAVIETKSGGSPSSADRILWELGYRPVKVSKFCTSLSALYPELPHNKWTRALRQPWSVESKQPLALAS